MSDYERVKKWREKNRERYNLYQRNRRKELKANQAAEPIDGASEAHAIPAGRTVGSSPATGAISTLEYLKGLERAEREKTRVEAPVSVPARFGMYRDDGGRPITERAWNELQKKKERAEKGGYVYDEFSQA